MIKSVKFPAQWKRTGIHGSQITETRETVFALGLGSCGKVVERILTEAGQVGMTITQVCDDGATKRFFYQWRDILGRVEIEEE